MCLPVLRGRGPKALRVYFGGRDGPRNPLIRLTPEARPGGVGPRAATRGSSRAPSRPPRATARTASPRSWTPAGRLLARGAYSPDSQIVARLWTFDGRAPDGALFRERFAAARRLREDVPAARDHGLSRRQLRGRPAARASCSTSTATTAVLELLTGGTEIWRAELEAAGARGLRAGRAVVRETGAASRDRRAKSPPARTLSPSGESRGRDRVPFLENGLRFFADVSRRPEDRLLPRPARQPRPAARARARPKRVLNLFSYSGAFSVAALAGGAARAVDVDSSARRARARPRAPRARTASPPTDADFVQADVFEDVRRRAAAGRALGRRRLRSARLREEEGRRRPGGARLQGRQPPRDGARRAGRLAADLLLLGPRRRRPLPEDRLLRERRRRARPSRSSRGRARARIIRSRSTARKGEYLKGLWLRRA